MENPRLGTSLEDFLIEEGNFAECRATAIKRVLAWQMAEAMKSENISRTEMAARMRTSRSAVARLLDPGNASISLQTMERAAQALGKRLEIQLV